MISVVRANGGNFYCSRRRRRIVKIEKLFSCCTTGEFSVSPFEASFASPKRRVGKWIEVVNQSAWRFGDWTGGFGQSFASANKLKAFCSESSLFKVCRASRGRERGISTKHDEARSKRARIRALSFATPFPPFPRAKLFLSSASLSLWAKLFSCRV